MIQIIPAIDIIDGKCVRLSQGDYNRLTTYTPTPADMAKAYADAGVTRLHLVDLDGAKAGHPCNLPALEEIASLGLIDIEWGGGIKDRNGLENVLDAGAGHAIIGSLAVRQPEIMEEWLEEFGGDKIILGADLRDGRVSVGGWLEDSSLTIHDLMERFLPHGLTEVITTDISKDGMLSGPSTDLYIGLTKRYPGVTFTVSGGISSMEDIYELDRLDLSRVIVGKAIYEGRITLREITDFISDRT
ncbi:MAG: 1-(5-phosphoribosyl)-5-[(5-phosphoribosylamino)methylideneamino]imidazole-4-carboxamide isomerase [Muribaculaceae bacterium]|nr:1-(5-phosphoribosyl)-5-[(5-phosphoribosylamino)methylideneamino]imidazole-4-carboxamide isomerase [Muribaculaceae bacterium]